MDTHLQQVISRRKEWSGRWPGERMIRHQAKNFRWILQLAGKCHGTSMRDMHTLSPRRRP